MDNDYWSYDGGMVSDNAKGKSRGKASKGRVPKLSILKATRSRRIPRTEFGEAMGGFTVGLVFVFPAITAMTLAFPLEVLGIVGIIACLFWVFTQRFFFAVVCVGLYIAMFLLGLITMGILASILH